MPESVDPRHLLLIGAGPGIGASVVRRLGREGFRRTLISRSGTLEQLAPELRSDGLEIESVVADIDDLDDCHATVGRLRAACDVDVLGAVVAAQVAAPVLRTDGRGTLLFTNGGFATHPVPAVASLSICKAALRSAATLVAAGVQGDGIHAAYRDGVRPGQHRGALLDRPHRPGRRLADRVSIHSA
jgi:short chain dehydrogenase